MQMLFKDENQPIIEEVHNRWSGIYRAIGTSDLESDILRFTATLVSKRQDFSFRRKS